MAKKDDMLRGGLSNLLGGGAKRVAPEQQPEKVTQPARKSEKKTESAKYGRLCAVVNVEKMDKMRAIAEMEGLQIKDVLEAAMDLAIQRYEKKHGEIQLNAKKEKKSAKGLFS